jgi:hypothetical protein
VVLPVLTPVIDALSFALSLFNRLPRPVKQFTAALAGLFILSQLAALQKTLNALRAVGAVITSAYASAVTAYQFAAFAATVASWSLAAALTAISAPVWMVIGAIGVVIGVLAAVAEYFGILDPIISAVSDAASGFIDWLGNLLDFLTGGGEGKRGGSGSPPSKAVEKRIQRKEGKTENNYKFNIDASGSDVSEKKIERLVKRSIEEKQREQRRTQSGQGG